ncbi:SMI1 / KNR4 family (SUKH-1) [Dyadobacter koreensis]|uniref:SMI1 / KNR4 family (SUKH-1) n=1 Tax=Dyadobacter koreensis TaxID=408657 RepID=A0A1H6XGW5_9BACT|nr:SMI1/KNR4 family protein [Dyadobacter koreensis]SEJ25927.1 SMI1 / KNR4 family (SUKH-1) [Dyadobacter koreensis]
MDSFLEKYSPKIENEPASLQDIAQLEAELGIRLPSDFSTFLRNVNGFEGFIGNSYAIFAPLQAIYQMTLDYCAELYPWAVFIGSNGGLEMFIIDTRSSPYQFGLLPFIADDSDFVGFGQSLEQFLEMLANL